MMRHRVVRASKRYQDLGRVRTQVACRLSRRGNRRLSHAIHMAAVTQVSHRHSPGRACYERKLAEGKTPEEALRSLKRRVSDAVFTQLQADARRSVAGSR